jgi:hypothetical protein
MSRSNKENMPNVRTVLRQFYNALCHVQTHESMHNVTTVLCHLCSVQHSNTWKYAERACCSVPPLQCTTFKHMKVCRTCLLFCATSRVHSVTFKHMKVCRTCLLFCRTSTVHSVTFKHTKECRTCVVFCDSSTVRTVTFTYTKVCRTCRLQINRHRRQSNKTAKTLFFYSNLYQTAQIWIMIRCENGWLKLKNICLTTTRLILSITLGKTT